MRKFLLGALVILYGCGSPSKAENTPAAPRISDFERKPELTPLQLIKSKSDPLRASLDKVLSNACNFTGKDPDEITYWELAFQCCDRDTVTGKFCNQQVIATNELPKKEEQRIGKVCVETVIALAESQKKAIFDLDRTQVTNACLKALDLPILKKEP